MNSLIVSQAEGLAKQFSIATGSAAELIAVLKATAFKGQVSDAQLTALLIVAQQYGLNPWTKEIYAFPDRNNGIVPVVGVDGWSRIINTHPMFDGMEYKQDDESCTCIIYRKDRAHPVSVTEYMEECRREGVGPWKSHPRRMLRHKATIQCARLAFGFVGIYEQDEAERIVEGVYSDVSGRSSPALAAIAQTIPEDTAERLALIAQVKQVASLGSARLQQEWERIGKDSRKLIADQLEGFKAIAAEADAAPADGEVEEAA